MRRMSLVVALCLVIAPAFSAGRLVQSSQIVAVTGNVLLPLLRHRRALILGSLRRHDDQHGE